MKLTLEDVKNMRLEGYDINLLVCGSRDIDDPYPIIKFLINTLTDEELKQYNIEENLYVVQGEARGIDLLAKESAIRLGIRTKDFPADWNTHGRRAGMIRNAEMVAIANCTFAVYDGVSSGTKHSIGISKKKGILTMVERDILPAGLTDEKIVSYLVKRHCISSLIFDITDNPAEILKKLDDLEDTQIDEAIIGVLSDSQIKPTGFSDLSLNYLYAAVLEAGYGGHVLRQVYSMTRRLRDYLVPKTVNKIYIKLETGGLSGYRRDLRGKGEEHYPVLRITLRVNVAPPLDIHINPRENFSKIDSKVEKMHKATGLLDRCVASNIDLEKANQMVREYLETNGVRNTNPASNVHTHLVGYNAEFNRAFLNTQFSYLTSLASPVDISIDKVSAIFDLEGSYELMPLPQIYGNDPQGYLEAMHQALIAIGKPESVDAAL